MSCSERPIKAGTIELERLLSCATDTSRSDDEQATVGEQEVIRPSIAARIEQAILAAANTSANLRPLRPVAEGTGPGEVVQVVRAEAGSHAWPHPRWGTRLVPPERGNDVIDVKLTHRRQEAVFAGVTSAQSNDEANPLVPRIVLDRRR